MKYLGKKRIAVIPARGGSKRIPKKNIKSFLNKPIILRVLEEVSSSKMFQEIHVSTEDEEIAEIVSKAGYKPRFKRDISLAGDEIPLSEVLKSVIYEYQSLNESFDTIVLVFATAVLIDHILLKQAIEEFEAGDSSIQLLSVAKYPAPLEKAMHMRLDTQLVSIKHEEKLFSTKYHPELWYETGDFVIYNEHSAMANNTNSLKRGFPMPRWLSADIDTPEDWDWAEKLFKLKKLLLKNN